MKFENTEVFNFKGALRGMRNPKNSWDRSDTKYGKDGCPFPKVECVDCQLYNDIESPCFPLIGENDMKLAQALIKGGSEHRKFLRQIFVSVDITAPLYWFKEFDTYKIGTTANSTSTMHKLSETPITLDCFETDDYSPSICGKTVEQTLIPLLETLRQLYTKTKNKVVWKELIRWLPESWLQTRTVTMNYENIFNMVHQRKHHKLNEWSGADNPEVPNFISWVKTLPYAKEFIFIGENEQ